MAYAENARRRQAWKQGLASGTLKDHKRPPMSPQAAAEILTQVRNGQSYSGIANQTGVPKTTLRTAVNRLRAELGKKHRAVSKPSRSAGKGGGVQHLNFDNLQVAAGAAGKKRGGGRKRKAA